MKKLDITKIEVSKGLTKISWHRYNTEDSNQDDRGVWEIPNALVSMDVFTYARMHTDADIEVKMNLD